MPRLLPLLTAVLLSASVVSSRAAYAPTTGTLGGADEDALEHSSSNASGGRGFLEFRSRNVAGTERHATAFFRFDLAGSQGPQNNAEFRLWIADSVTDSDAFTIDVYGIVDGVADEFDWSASALSYANAPGLNPADSPINIDRDHTAGETVYLGTLHYPGANYSGALSLTSPELDAFLQADANDRVTFLLEPQVAATGQDFFVHLRTYEGVGTTAGDFAPTLRLPSATPPGETPPTPTDIVTVAETTGDFTLVNGLVRAVVAKSTGTVTDLRLEGGTNLLLNGGKLYFDSNSGGSYYAFSGATYTLVENTGQHVHVRLAGRMGELDAELHYLLRVGEKGLHSYVVFRHGAGDAATYLEQARMVLRCDKNVFTRAYTSEQKTGQMVSPALLAAAPVIMDATQALPLVSDYLTPSGTNYDGLPVYTKYDWADSLETHRAHGLSGDNIGLWMLSGSEEYMNGGPTKGELLVHGTDTTPLMIRTFHAGHFVGSDANVQLAANEAWEKVYGPHFIYVNTGPDAASLWADALARADAEKAAWPPAWMNEPAFPTIRGSVTGSLFLHGQTSANALLVLAQPGSDWQAQGRDYLFWTRTDATGSFTLSQVRPGSYSLYVCAPGASGQAELAGVVVTGDTANHLGRITWAPPRRERTLWQIGTPDRSTAEFRHGNLMRQFGLWWRYLEERGSQPLNFTIGTSQPATDWYYAQSVVALEDGSYLAPTWNVNFTLDAKPTGPSELVFDLAGAMQSTVNLTLNNTSIGSFNTTNDGGLYRSTTSFARYRQHRVSVDSALLRAGANTLGIRLNGRSNWSGTRPVSPASGVMYDSLRLETGASQTETLLREYRVEVVAGTGGIVSGGGWIVAGTTTTISAAASPGYRFVSWSDGATEAIRTVTVNAAASYAATFATTPTQTFAEWALALPALVRGFTDDADFDGVANGIEYAYGETVAPTLLTVHRDGTGAYAALATPPTEAGLAHTTLEVQASRDPADWSAGAVTLVETQVAGERRWSASSPEPKLFFRAVVRLQP